MKMILMLLVLVTVLLAGCSTDCEVADVEAADQAMIANEAKWSEADVIHLIHSNAPLLTMEKQLADLQEIRSELDSLEVPVCMEKAKSTYLTSRQLGIDAFQSHMQGAAEDDVVTIFAESMSLRRAANMERSRVLTCAPDCPAK